MGNSVIEIHAATIDHSPAITRLPALATGGDDQRLRHVVQRYRNDLTAVFLVAVVEYDTVGVIGYSVGESAVTLLHVAAAPHARNAGVGTQLLNAVRRAVPAGLPIVAETDQDAVGFYAANNFAVTSLGEKYPGVQRFRVHLRAPANPGAGLLSMAGRELSSNAEINALWEAWTPSELAQRMAWVATPWYVAAGWALELFTGDAAREHADLEIAIPAGRFGEIIAAFPGFDWDVVGDGQIWQYPDQAANHHQTWLREPATGATASTYFANPTSAVCGCAGAIRRSPCPTAS
jgi:GNAT superfamily N-acetyltransferase